MNQKTQMALFSYMQAHIKLNSICEIDLTPENTVEIFSILPPPKVTFDRWLVLVGFDPEDVEDNENVLNIVKSMGIVKEVKETPKEE